MTLHIRKPGLLTTVQDLGRTGYRRFGVNTNGVMDIAAARSANILLGNDENAPVLEMHFPAGEFEFVDACCFAIAGADFSAMLSGVPISNWSVHTAGKGSVLQFAARLLGARAYLAVGGGFNVNKWLGSASTNLLAGRGGFAGTQCKKSDRIPFDSSSGIAPRRLGPSMIPRYSRFPTVRIIAGPEFDWLTNESRDRLIRTNYSLLNSSNRMGYRLSGEPLDRIVPDEMLSSAVTFGTIQLLPDGQLIVLMADHQTTGGYPRIANVIAADLPLLAQIGPGDGVGFHIISIADAQTLSDAMERDRRMLRVGCMFG
jgi:antagonist of KipI